MKVSFHNLGCKVNSYETESMQQQLEAAGFEVVPFTESADVCIVNTCSVTNIADRKSRQMLHKARKLNPDAIIAAVGCYAQLVPEELAAEGTVNIIAGNNNKGRILELIKAYKDNPGNVLIAVDDLSKACGYEDIVSTRTDEHTRAYIKIQDGCNQFCSYCIIPFARGRIRSRAIPDIVDEVSKLAEGGYKEIVLTGINMSAYGDACDDELIDVIEAVARVKGIERIRISSLEPNIITEDFLGRLSAIDKVCPHFHLSLQSGCDTVLSRMNRKYTTAEYLEKCKLIRRYYDLPALTTDIIVGFPGESEEEFRATLDFVKECAFYEVHIFKYSRRRGTKADKMPGQLTDKEKSLRSDRLEEAEAFCKKNYLKKSLGRKATVLLEEEIRIDGRPYLTGHTKEYVKALIPAGPDFAPGMIVTGELAEYPDSDMLILRGL